MNLILVSVILVLIMAITNLCFDFYKQKQRYEKRIDVLEDIIATLQEKQTVQGNQLRISDTLSKHLKDSNHLLKETIYEANVDLISVSFNKKQY